MRVSHIALVACALPWKRPGRQAWYVSITIPAKRRRPW